MSTSIVTAHHAVRTNRVNSIKSSRMHAMGINLDAISIKRTTVFVFLLFICRVRCEYLCGSRFDDLPSRTILAPVVFEGKAQRLHSWSEPGKGLYYNFTFRVDTVLKGSLPQKDSGKGYRSIVVGVFGDKAVRTKCISPKVELGLSYIVFLNLTIHGRANKLNIHRITSFPEIASNETIETVRSYSCSKCGRSPSCQIQLRGKTNGTIGKKLRLHCKVKGRPFPQVNWVKDGRPVVLKKGLRIKPHSQGSNLEIRQLKHEDSGLYECQAVNALGSSNWSRIQVKAMYVSDSILCSDQSYCLNNGTCYILQTLSRRYCKCPEPFGGKRCIEKKVDIEGISYGPEAESPFEMAFIMPIIGVVLIVVITICIVILSYCAISNLWRQYQAKKAKDTLENSYHSYSFGIHEGSLKCNQSGRRMSKSSTPLLKDVFTQTEGSPVPARKFAIVRPDSSKPVILQSDQPRKGSTGSGKVSTGSGKVSTGSGKVSTGSGKVSSSPRRGRLNGCSVTPPDLSQHRRKVHSPIAERISSSSDVAEEHPTSKTDAIEARPGNHIQAHPVDAAFRFKERNRNSEYDNCWLDDNRDVIVVCDKGDSHARIDETCNDQATSSASVQKSRT